jgi:hypothetical protein
MFDCKKLAADFIEVCRLAGITLAKDAITLEELAPGPEHEALKSLPSGTMAVYAFLRDTDKTCLKVGKVNRNSGPRFVHHHYHTGSSNSNLASSLWNDASNEGLFANEEAVGPWIKANTRRINFYLPADTKTGRDAFILNLLEAFLQAALNPRYEGYKSQKTIEAFPKLQFLGKQP